MRSAKGNDQLKQTPTDSDSDFIAYDLVKTRLKESEAEAESTL